MHSELRKTGSAADDLASGVLRLGDLEKDANVDPGFLLESRREISASAITATNLAEPRLAAMDRFGQLCAAALGLGGDPGIYRVQISHALKMKHGFNSVKLNNCSTTK